MCSSGAWQLSKLTLRFCAQDGASRGMRCVELRSRGSLADFPLSPPEFPPLFLLFFAPAQRLHQGPRALGLRWGESSPDGVH
jgi:hypothetical protein